MDDMDKARELVLKNYFGSNGISMKEFEKIEERIKDDIMFYIGLSVNNKHGRIFTILTLVYLIKLKKYICDNEIPEEVSKMLEYINGGK